MAFLGRHNDNYSILRRLGKMNKVSIRLRLLLERKFRNVFSVMIARSLTIPLISFVILFTPLVSEAIPVGIYTDAGPVDSQTAKTYGILARRLILQGGNLTSNGFVPYYPPSEITAAYDPADPSIPENLRSSIRFSSPMTVETLQKISGRYVTALGTWEAVKSLPGEGIFTRSDEVYTINLAYFVMVNLKGKPVEPNPKIKPVISIRTQSPIASEAGLLNGQFLVILNNARTSDTIIYLSIGGTAINGKDYQKINKKVTVQAGKLSSAIDIVPIDDAKREKQESVKLTLLSKKAYKLANIKKAVLTITDND